MCVKINYATLSDFESWLNLAREVEHLFGPMADDDSFHDALRQAIADKTAICIRSGYHSGNQTLEGGIVISKESNEILWFAVSGKSRGKGYGKALLSFAVN